MSSRRRVPLLLRVSVLLLPRGVREEVLGDLLEERANRAGELSRAAVLLWEVRQVGAALRWKARETAHTRRPSETLGINDIRRARWRTPASWLDVKLAFRMMRRQPLLTIVVGLTLALGIPSSLFPAHLMGILEASFPVEDGRRVLGLRNWNTETGRPAADRIHEFAAWRDAVESFQTIGAARTDAWNVHSADGRAEEVRGAAVSPSVFEMLRTPPLHGRWLLPSDEGVGTPDVVVISHALWASRFGSDPGVVGRTITLGRIPHILVGVMPEGFLFPRAEHLWIPLRLDLDAYPVGEGPSLQVFGRLADGVTVEAAAAEFRTVGARLAAGWPETHTRLRPEVVTIGRLVLRAPARGWVPEVLVVQLLSLGLLVVACGNVGTLVLARTAMRTGEMSVRTALGASRRRILSQMFVELFVLAVVASGVGLALGDRVSRFAVSGVLDGIPYWYDPSVGVRTVLLTVGLAAVCAVGAGVLPALKATRAGVQANLNQRAAGSSVRFGVTPTVLIVAEVALSIGFLTLGVAAMAASRATDPEATAGLDLSRHVGLSWQLPDQSYWLPSGEEGQETARTSAMAPHEELSRRLLADPATRRVAMGWDLPGTPFPPARRVVPEGRTYEGTRSAPRAVVARVHFRFFEDMGRPVLEGRGFGTADAVADPGGDATSVLVNQQFVAQVLGGADAVGRRIRYQDGRGPERDRWYEIIGVVGDLAPNPHNPGQGAAVYHPIAATGLIPMRFLIELNGDPESFLGRARRIAAGVDPEAAVRDLRVVSEVVEAARFDLTMRSLFTVLLSLVGTLLAAMGLHALMSFTVSQRTREIGIRAALGARASSIVSSITTRAAAQLLGGVALGVPLGYWVVTDALSGLYRPVSPVAVVAMVATVVLLIGALACLAPTLRGLRIQPTEALRSDG